MKPRWTLLNLGLRIWKASAKDLWLQAIDQTEMWKLVVDAWRMVVPKRVAADYLGDHP
jgi:hypothetical protein